MGPPIPMLGYDLRYSSGKDSVQFVENKYNVSVPVYKSEAGGLFLSLAGSQLSLGESITLDSQVKIPTELYRLETGFQYFEQLPEKKRWGLKGSVGYASDKQFSKDLTYSLSANYGYPDSENGYWMLMVFFSNNGPFGNNIPIPGFIYIYRTETFTGMFGLPVLAMQWAPVFPWSFSFSLFGPIIQMEAAYNINDEMQIFSGFNWNRQNYILSDRVNDKDRLTFEEKKLLIGVRSLISNTLLAELQIGQTFDRSAYIGSGFLNKDQGNASISSDIYSSLSLKMKF